ncbi:hypothetical protein [Aeromonas veronii]|uniref:hypothetical protein n=1 Tax=Aeromonas veronii TaxID=654 RepID=UPI00288FF0A8|nr:hypothetical protein [Aeromonas dhakensis]
MKLQTLNLEKQGVMVFGVELQRLISLTQEQSVRMPSGLTREQRREWAKQAAKGTHQTL